MPVQSILPPEIICHILCFLGPCDIVRLRTVSRRFRDISYLPVIWRILYACSRLPRPPGPFPYQTVEFLERTLVKSERLTQSWTTQPMRDVSTARVPLEGFPSSTPKIINGRWLIGCESSRKFVAHDIDSVTVPQFRRVMWEQHEIIRGWDACAAMSTDGPVVYIVYSVIAPGCSWKLLEFRVDSTTGHLCYSLSLDIPTKKFVQMEWLHGSHGPFLSLRWHRLVFHVETRRFYKVPPYESALGILPSVSRSKQLVDSSTLFTETHVITLSRMIHDTPTPSTFVQALTLPHEECPNPGNPGLLCVSHEGIIGDWLENVSIIRNSVVDPVTRAINVRLLCRSCKETGAVRLSCIDFTLPKNAPCHANTVLPIAIAAYDVLKVDNAPYISGPGMTCHVESSDDGHTRGFLQFRRVGAFPPDYQFMRFSIDASGERCTGVIGEMSHPGWGWIDHQLWLDGARGRLCYTKRWVSEDEEEAKLAFVVDVE